MISILHEQGNTGPEPLLQEKNNKGMREESGRDPGVTFSYSNYALEWSEYIVLP